MKTIKVEDKAHLLLKKYCNKNGLKIIKFVSNLIIETVNKSNEEKNKKQ